MSDQPDQNVLFMLGEMRADLKYLVNERGRQAERMDDLEASLTAHEARTTKLEHFRTKIGVLATGLGIIVPTAITAAAHKLGLLQ